MISFYLNINPIYQALLAGLFTFFVTMLGSAMVFFFKNINKNIMDIMLSISAGIMLSASYFSLLCPAIDTSKQLGLNTWFIVCFGFMIGGLFLLICDKLIDYFSANNTCSGIKRCIMLFTSITLHNIPEGLVLGVAFGGLLYESDTINILSCLTLTLGIAIQNFPEGSAISLPLRREGFTRFKSFLIGSLSAIVEPIAAILGALLVIKIKLILPFIMSFTAGAMIFVTCLELIPESQNNQKKDLMTFFLMLGFSLMMLLELLFG